MDSNDKIVTVSLSKLEDANVAHVLECVRAGDLRERDHVRNRSKAPSMYPIRSPSRGTLLLEN